MRFQICIWDWKAKSVSLMSECVTFWTNRRHQIIGGLPYSGSLHSKTWLADIHRLIGVVRVL